MWCARPMGRVRVQVAITVPRQPRGFEVRGVGYRDADVIPLLQSVNTAFNPETIHEPIDVEYKEFGAGRRYPWAYDRVM